MMLCCKIMLGRSQLKQEKSLSIHLRKDFRWLGGGSFVYIYSVPPGPGFWDQDSEYVLIHKIYLRSPWYGCMIHLNLAIAIAKLCYMVEKLSWSHDAWNLFSIGCCPIIFVIKLWALLGALPWHMNQCYTWDSVNRFYKR